MPLPHILAPARRAIVALGAATLLGSLAACGDSTSPDREPIDAFVTASIDGQSWAANYQVNQAVADLWPQGERLEIVGLDLEDDFSGRQLSVVIIGFDGPGTYTIGSAAADADGSFAYYIQSPDVRATGPVREANDLVFLTDAADAGTITIASFDQAAGTVAGTFSFDASLEGDATEVVSVTNGAFSGRVVQSVGATGRFVR